jgi:hypothetical protein
MSTNALSKKNIDDCQRIRILFSKHLQHRRPYPLILQPNSSVLQFNPQYLRAVPTRLNHHNFDDQNFGPCKIQNLVSNNTTQGIIYRVEIGDNDEGIMKKSPIVKVRGWIKFHELLETINNKNHNIEQRKQAKSEIEPLVKEIRKQQLTLDCPSTIDALGYWIGSKLVESGLSCFYPLLYYTERMYDDRYFGAKLSSRNFQVQITIMQKLEGTLQSLLDSPYFFSGPILKSSRISMMIAQIVFGVAGGYEHAQLVHNDLHMKNIMFTKVPVDSILYYKYKTWHLKIPTFGTIFKQIDFGRASFVIDGDTGLYSKETIEVDKQWQPKRIENDILRPLSLLFGNFFIKHNKDEQSLATKFLYKLFRYVLYCTDENGSHNMINMKDRCIKNYLKQIDQKLGRKASTEETKKIQNYCAWEEFSVGPYTSRSKCNMGHPFDLIEKFFLRSPFAVDATEIPSDAHVYVIRN